MEKNKLIEIKKRLLALSLAGVMIGNAGCTSNEDENKEPTYSAISSEYSNVEDYYKYVIQDGEAVKLYNAQNVYLLFNKETYEATEYIYYRRDILYGLGIYGELYDLQSEEMIAYCNGINKTYNKEYFNYLVENNYQVCLAEASDYIEEHTSKEYYSLEEIIELEPQIAESLKIINSAKVKTKTK
jgi:hypothetical protein